VTTAARNTNVLCTHWTTELTDSISTQATIKLLINAHGFLRTWALEPLASIRSRHFVYLETRHLLQHWPQAPGM